MLHQLPRSEDDPPNKVRVELVVLDSGKVCHKFRVSLAFFDMNYVVIGHQPAFLEGERELNFRSHCYSLTHMDFRTNSSIHFHRRILFKLGQGLV
jgi:hypothetical protein